MTTPAPFGRTLAFAEQVLSEVLRRHLAERGVVPETWYALQLIDVRGPHVSRDDLSRALERSRALTVDSTRALLVRLNDEGLIRGEAAIDLTAAGETLYRDLREYVGAPAARLLSQFDADDVATTLRTLQAITAKAEEGLVDVA
jgi:DNA-binding MarR family transcriptional regulator